MYIYNMSKNSIIISLFCVVFLIRLNTINAQNIAIQKQINTLIQPPYIKTGDTIAIVAPSGILKRTKELFKKLEEKVISSLFIMGKM